MSFSSIGALHSFHAKRSSTANVVQLGEANVEGAADNNANEAQNSTIQETTSQLMCERVLKRDKF